MSLALLAMVAVIVIGMLLGMPVGLAMWMSGAAYLAVEGLCVAGGTVVCVCCQPDERRHGERAHF